MRKIAFMVLAAAVLLGGGVLARTAQAMPLAAPPAAIAGAADTGIVQKAAIVCGYYGCVRTFPRYYGYYRPYGYYRRPYGYYRRW